MKLEIGLKLKKTLGEIESMPHQEFLLWAQLLITKGEEQKKSLEKPRKGR